MNKSKSQFHSHYSISVIFIDMNHTYMLLLKLDIIK